MYHSICHLFTIKTCQKVRQQSLEHLLVETSCFTKLLLDLRQQVLQIYLFSTHYRISPFGEKVKRYRILLNHSQLLLKKIEKQKKLKLFENASDLTDEVAIVGSFSIMSDSSNNHSCFMCQEKSKFMKHMQEKRPSSFQVLLSHQPMLLGVCLNAQHNHNFHFCLKFLGYSAIKKLSSF